MRGVALFARRTPIRFQQLVNELGHWPDRWPRSRFGW
jgi:hypothetical protein